MMDVLITPFVEYSFMRRALAICIAIACSGAPLGVFLTLRRMTLVGDALSHAILPGVSVAFLITGLALWPMTIGGVIGGLCVAMLAGWIARIGSVREDASFTSLYLIALAAGVLLLSMKGSAVDLMHVLFGNVLAVGADSLYLVTAIATGTLCLLAVFYRGLVTECADPGFMRVMRAHGPLYHQLLLVLLVLNLVAAFQALGTLMALGIMLLPAIAARLWSRRLDMLILLSILFGIASAYIGLLASYHIGVPSGPAIVLVAGAIYLLSLTCGPVGGLMPRLLPHHHYRK